MTAAERIAKLVAENAALRAELAAVQHPVTLLTERLQDLEQRLTPNSHKGSEPPSSDRLRRRPRNQRVQSERKPGGQPDHTGHTLALIAIPDVEVLYRPAVCSACQCPLEGAAGQVIERRHVQDLPALSTIFLRRPLPVAWGT
jgi:transposase